VPMSKKESLIDSVAFSVPSHIANHEEIANKYCEAFRTLLKAGADVTTSEAGSAVRVNFIEPVTHETWKETVQTASEGIGWSPLGR